MSSIEGYSQWATLNSDAMTHAILEIDLTKFFRFWARKSWHQWGSDLHQKQNPPLQKIPGKVSFPRISIILYPESELSKMNSSVPKRGKIQTKMIGLGEQAWSNPLTLFEVSSASFLLTESEGPLRGGASAPGWGYFLRTSRLCKK